VAEQRLVANAAAGDQRACEAPVERYLPAISGVARLYRNARVEHVDLTQEGVVGLLRAARRFDPELEVPFWAYAGWWVRQAMQQLVSELTRSAVLSDRAMRALAAIKRARRELGQASGHEPAIADLVRATGLARAQIEALLAIDRFPRELEEPIGDESSDLTWGARVVDATAEDEYERAIEHVEIQRIRPLVDSATLDEREREILYARYGLDRPTKTLHTIGDELGISAERVRQIEEGALRKLREAALGHARGDRDAPRSNDGEHAVKVAKQPSSHETDHRVLLNRVARCSYSLAHRTGSSQVT
jgi:RNA polymerase primary sigma factor